jgi:deoxyinosine 3'endonuclease (endonuclease V)
LNLKKEMILTNDVDWTLEIGKPNTLKYIGGVDISFVKDNHIDACAALVVLSYPDYEVLYENYKHVQLTLPYIPGFLAFREVSFLMDFINDLRNTQPDLLPQLMIVDGNGILHPQGFGLACHLGVLSRIPTFGCGKNLFVMDGLEMKSVKAKFKETTHQSGDYMKLVGDSGICWGVAYKTTSDTKNPIFLSQGHRVDLETIIKIANTCSTARVLEPDKLI